MLQITIPATERFDERTSTFSATKETTLQLEHSLVSISKWESKWEKPFLGKDEKTMEQCVDYVRCMTITQNVNPDVYDSLTPDIFEKINKYIEAPMTATWFNERQDGPKSREIITSEIIYYWMIALNVPFECQRWHLNKLLTLIKVCNIKNTPPKKMGRGDIMSRNRALNASRRNGLKSRG